GDGGVAACAMRCCGKITKSPRQTRNAAASSKKRNPFGIMENPFPLEVKMKASKKRTLIVGERYHTSHHPFSTWLKYRHHLQALRKRDTHWYRWLNVKRECLIYLIHIYFLSVL